MAKKNWYAVVQGRRPGLYRTWAECEAQVKGCASVFKGFSTQEEALAYLRQHGSGGGLHEAEAGNPGPDAACANQAAATRGKPSQGLDKAVSAAPEQARQHGAFNSTGPSSHGDAGAGIIQHHSLWFDGGSRGNGTSTAVAGSGAVLYNGASKVWEGGRYLGCATNNVAEYTGLIHGLEVAKSLRVTHLEVRGDSQLVLSQVKGEWRCEKPHLKELCVRAQTLAASFRVCTFIHVLRARNLTQADALANRAMDSHADFEEMCPDGLGPEHDHSPGGKRARSPAPDERVAQRARRV